MIAGMFLRRLLAPVHDRVTYRRWVYLILGGALSVPYLLFGAILVPSSVPLVATLGTAGVIGGLSAFVVVVLTSFLPAVRALEGAALRELLDDPVPDTVFGPAKGRRARLRHSAVFVLHVGVGGVVSFLSLALPALFAFSIAAAFTGKFTVSSQEPIRLSAGWPRAWLPLVLLLSIVVLVYVVNGVGAVLTKIATRLLGLSAAERIEQLERRTDRLVERNRLARELHDSVGHALSVVTIQAGAGRRTLRTDPDFTEQALLAIEESARSALEELDHVLGLLREESSGKAPQADLAGLPPLLSATRLAGVHVDAEVSGELDSVPPVVSREAYRILQECLTNALKHAGKVPVSLRVVAGDRRLELAVSNALGADVPAGRDGGGRGLRGMAERVEVLRGELSAGRNEDRWEVLVRLPWGSAR
ncbi:MAG: sensor histidine kinase [Amycolatopsis sp.]|jgi:signal transduction histidine kinase|nr:sensor histidine kinase [Amycolatopsis sp.]